MSAEPEVEWRCVAEIVSGLGVYSAWTTDEDSVRQCFNEQPLFGVARIILQRRRVMPPENVAERARETGV